MKNRKALLYTVKTILFGIAISLSFVLQGQETTGVQKNNVIIDTTASAQIQVVDTLTEPASKTMAETILAPPSLADIISISNIFWTIIFLLIGYFGIKLIIAFLNSLTARKPKYEFSVKRLIPIIRILSWFILIYIIIVGVYNPPASTLLAALASLGVAVGFAAQDLLKNVFGGLVVMFDRPFQIGDKIEAGKFYGEVTEIGIRSTKIVTADDSEVSIPNSEFMSQYVSNSNSGQNNCQVVAEIYLPVDIDTSKVREIAIKSAQVSQYIYLNKPIVIIFVNEIVDRKLVLKMRIKAYVSDLSKEFVFKSEMTEIVLGELIRQKILNENFYLSS
ncbi:MAG: mechanosensitive ion channel family protein [Bacteroidales bacterium]|nr:mechanosensitive ion channel family protein [Bacteroidales bacterium]MCF8456769.1 mechanosensitive ion channel family protein [Bacteroidales bacterium]